MLAMALAMGLAVSAGTAVAAPGPKLKQFRVPTANSEPRAITTGSDGNIWFTEGTEFTGAPAKLARITPTGTVTEFAPGVADGCNGCILTDVVQGPDDILYVTSNDPTLIRFDTQTGLFLDAVDMPNSGALAGDLAIGGNDLWISDFNNDSLWRYDIPTGQFTQFPVPEPADVTVDADGNVWFTAPLNGSVARLDPVTGGVTEFPAEGGLIPRSIAIATDGQVWFTSRFVPQGVGRLDPVTGDMTAFLTPTNPGPEGIAASPDGSVWFTQTTKGNIASIDNDGVITEGKAVRGSEPFGITVDASGDPWYTMFEADKIATLRLP
jgi:virginiamycin B lyase